MVTTMTFWTRCKTSLRLWLIPRLLGRTFSLCILAPGNEELPLLPAGSTMKFKIFTTPGHVMLPLMILNQAFYRRKSDKTEYLFTFLTNG